MEYSHFVPELFVRDGNNQIRGLCVKVCGKSDGEVWKYRWLWADDECPDLCPVRHLLIYVFVSGIKGGYLFPKTKELVGRDKPDDGVFQTCVPYSTHRRQFIELVERVLPEYDIKVGLHMWRKTAYLLGIWGGGV